MSVIETTSGVAKGKQARVKLGRPKLGQRPRSAITSGRQQFINGDSNSAWARRFHDIVVGLVSDAGGRDQLSEAEFAIAKRAAGLMCECERFEAHLSRGDHIDLDRYGRAASHARRLLESLGFQRRARTINDDPRLLNVWPQYRAQEARRLAREDAAIEEQL
jgi:hypothetical protein